MTGELLQQFRQCVANVIEPVAASAQRKKLMQEELLAHLCSIYEEEQAAATVDAMDAALQRLGNAEELRGQLQDSVPTIEKLFHAFFDAKENSMSRGWIIWLVAVLLLWGVMVPAFALGVVVALAGVGFVRYCNKAGPGAKLLQPLLGLFGILLGAGLILPALAKYKQNYPTPVHPVPLGLMGEIAVPWMMGLLFSCAGLMLCIRAIRPNHGPAAC